MSNTFREHLRPHLPHDVMKDIHYWNVVSSSLHQPRKFTSETFSIVRPLGVSCHGGHNSKSSTILTMTSRTYTGHFSKRNLIFLFYEDGEEEVFISPFYKNSFVIESTLPETCVCTILRGFFPFHIPQ